jgi:hypothetical protein
MFVFNEHCSRDSQGTLMADGTHALRSCAQAVRTLVDTGHSYDAGVCGFAGPIDAEAGGLRLVFDGRSPAPSVILTSQGGEIEVTGLPAIETVSAAWRDAAARARRMSR